MYPSGKQGLREVASLVLATITLHLKPSKEHRQNKRPSDARLSVLI